MVHRLDRNSVRVTVYGVTMSEPRDFLSEPEDLPITSDFAGLTRDSMVFALGAVTGKAVGLVMLPILTRTLSPEQYGSADVLMSLGTAATATLLLGLDVAALRLYFDQTDDASRRRLMSTWMAIGLLVSGSAAIVIAWQARAISTVLFGDSSLEVGVAAVAVIVVAQTVHVVALTVFRAVRRAWMYALLSGGVLVMYAVMAVALLTVWRADANTVVISWAAALAVSASVGVFFVRGRVLGRPSSGLVAPLLRLGLPLALGVAASLVADFANRAILLGSSGASNVALLTVALRFASVAGLAVAGFQLAWLPHALALGSGEASRKRIGVEGRQIVAIVAVLVTGVAVVSPELVRLVAGAAYGNALPALGLSLVGVLASALFLLASLPSVLTRHTKDVGLAVGSGVALALLLNLVLARPFGSTGTAAAVTAGQLVAALLAAALGRRRLVMRFGRGRIAVLVGVSAAVAVLITTVLSGAPLVIRVTPVILMASALLLEDRGRLAASTRGWLRRGAHDD